MSGIFTELRPKVPNDRLIAYLETLLEDARSGEVVSVAGALIFHGGNSSEFWVMADKSYDLHLHSDRLVGALERMKFQMMCHRQGIDTDDTWIA